MFFALARPGLEDPDLVVLGGRPRRVEALELLELDVDLLPAARAGRWREGREAEGHRGDDQHELSDRCGHWCASSRNSTSARENAASYGAPRWSPATVTDRADGRRSASSLGDLMSLSSAPATTRVGTVMASKRTEYRSDVGPAQGGERLTVGAGEIGELAERLPGDALDRRRIVGQERGRDCLGRRGPRSRWHDRRSHPAEHERGYAAPRERVALRPSSPSSTRPRRPARRRGGRGPPAHRAPSRRRRTHRGRAACPSAPWPRASVAMTRRPAPVSASMTPGRAQLST